ncbi:hypothetical protein IV203_018753 [Nitzschia inconspicua]|uniref:Uncharacterized protein n=1 Tax=Nitzschia inconspicua TaxID=303405 RepID=A0A9K3Q6V5_9STRA|nr:hypothetical protein IV203_018753 [Nitzschia inconspicua]
MSNGYYVHPYILFGRAGRGNKGFICANAAAAIPASSGTPASPAVVPDLPASLSDFIESCSLAIWSLLSQDKMFPDKSLFQTLVRKAYGRGYEALRHMIMRTSTDWLGSAFPSLPANYGSLLLLILFHVSFSCFYFLHITYSTCPFAGFLGTICTFDDLLTGVSIRGGCCTNCA